MTTENALPGMDGLWVTISELAEQKGVRKQSIAERVARLEERGLIKTRPGKGRAKLVNLAEYDRVLGEVGDLGRELGAATKRLTNGDPEDASPSTDPVYTKEQARLAAYRADILKLELEERRGNCVRVDLLTKSVDEAAQNIARVIDGIVHETDSIVIAASKGPQAIRVELKNIATKMRSRISEQLAAAAAAAPEFDPPLES